MDVPAFSGPALGALMVFIGIVVGVGRRGHDRAFWRPDKSVGFALQLLVGLCLLYGTAWLFRAL